jgi:hypothetical protein
MRDVIEMAREANLYADANWALWPTGNRWKEVRDERFAELVRADERALAAPVQEPVAWAIYQQGRLQSFWLDKGDAYDFEFTTEHQWQPLYTAAQRTWVGLTDEERTEIRREHYARTLPLMDAVEAKLRSKNT